MTDAKQLSRNVFAKHPVHWWFSHYDVNCGMIVFLLPYASSAVLAFEYCRCLPVCVCCVCVCVCVCVWGGGGGGGGGGQSRAHPRHNSSPVSTRITQIWIRNARHLGWDLYYFGGWSTLTYKVNEMSHHRMTLEPSNSDKRCKAPWLTSLLLGGWLTLTFKVKFYLQSTFHHVKICTPNIQPEEYIHDSFI